SGDLNGPNLEGWTTLAALAQATKRIRIGCQVTGMIYRHPAVLANMAAAVDIISDGRLEPDGMRRLRHRTASIAGAFRPLRRGCRGDRLPARAGDHDPGRAVRAPHRREVQPEARPASLPADHHRRPRPDPDAAHRGPLGAAVELPAGEPRRVA